MRILLGIMLSIGILNASGIAYIAIASMSRSWPVASLAVLMMILAVTLVGLVVYELYRVVREEK